MTDSRALASRGCSTRRIRPAVVALEADDRVQHALDAEPLREQLRADRVDEERQVLGAGLEHRARALVAVLGGASG